MAKVFIEGKCNNQAHFLECLSERYGKDFSKEIIQIKSMISGIEIIPLTDEGMQQLLGTEGYIVEGRLCNLSNRFGIGFTLFYY